MATAFEERTYNGIGWGWLMLYGVVSVLVGLAALAWPFAATITATFIYAWFLTVTGIASLIAGFGAPAHSGRWYAILFGLLSALLGGYLMFQPVVGAASITLLLTIWLFARGVMELVFAFRFRRLRWTMLLLAAIDIVLAIYIWSIFPAAALTLLGFLIGISFLAGGVIAIFQAFDHRKGAAAF